MANQAPPSFSAGPPPQAMPFPSSAGGTSISKYSFVPAGLSAPGNDDNDDGNNEVPLYVPILNSLVSSIKGQVNVQGEEVLTTQQTSFQMESCRRELKWELEDVCILCEDETSPTT